MADRRNAVTLGQEVFILSPTGEIVRTMVGKLEQNSYTFLNGDDERCPHWFSFQEAASAATDRITTRIDRLQQEIRGLKERRRQLGTEKYKSGVRNAPYRVVELRDREAFKRRSRTRNLKYIHLPGSHLSPGEMAFAVITPSTETRWSDAVVYRPHKHFVLETEVKSVCLSPDGQVHYVFSTPFVVEEFFPSREEATARLRSFSEPGTEEPVPFVSSKQEEDENKKLLDDDVPF